MRKLGKRVLSSILAVILIMIVGCGKQEQSDEIRVGSMKGPTSMGLVELMEKSEKGETENNYVFTMETQPDVLLTMMMQGELDIALVPANIASVMYNKTEGGICVLDINTLGVLSLLSGDDSIQSFADLKGKTVYLTGKGTTPDYVFQYLLSANGVSVDDVTIEYKSESTEIVTLLANNPDAVGLLPQPFATIAMQQNSDLKQVIDLTVAWNLLQQDGSMMVTGVTVVRKDYLETHEEEVMQFLKDHKESAESANADIPACAQSVVKYGIMENETIAELAIPSCNITYLDKDNMRNVLSGYLLVLFEADPSSVGGTLPEADFYYGVTE